MNKKSNEFSAEQAIKALTNIAATYGITGFLLGFKNEQGLLTTHIERLPSATAFNIIITLFNQVCDLEATRPQATGQQREAVAQLQQDFIAAIKSYNKSV
jgi:hypothetical protein